LNLTHWQMHFTLLCLQMSTNAKNHAHTRYKSAREKNPGR